MAGLEETHQDEAGKNEIEVKSIDIPAIIARDSASMEQELASLSSSMSRFGQIEPIIVRPRAEGRYELICGQRRLRAARNLGWESIAARIVQADDRTVASMMLAENLERRDFTDFEVGIFFQKLADLYGMSLSEIADISGRSKSYVSQHIAMTELFPADFEPRALVVGVLQSLTERQARILSKVSEVNLRLAFARIAINENLCVKELEKLVGKSPNYDAQEIRTLVQSSKSGDYRPRDEEQIRDKIESLFGCVNNLNLQPLITFRDAEFTLFDDFPPLSLQRGKVAISHCFDVVESAKGGMKFLHSRPHVRTFKGFAIATLYVTYNPGGGKSRSRVSVVFQKKKGKWIIVHEHWSPIPRGHAQGAQAASGTKLELLVGH